MNQIINGNSKYYIYDIFSRLTQVENALGELTAYTYDPAGNILTQTDGLGNATTMQYNARNLPICRIEPGGISGPSIDPGKAVQYTYNADGSVATMTDQNGTVTAYTYDIHGRMTGKTAGGESESLAYDSNGNIIAQTDGGGTTTRTYDSLDRMTSKNVPGIGLTTYLYDITAGMPPGHLGQTTTDPKGNATTSVYDRNGRLHQVISGTDTTTYAYFANGNHSVILITK